MTPIEKKTVKHTLRMTEKESQTLQKWAKPDRPIQGGVCAAKGFRQRTAAYANIRLLEPLAELSAIHDQSHDTTLRKQIQKLILEIQAEATSPKEVSPDGNNEAVAH